MILFYAFMADKCSGSLINGVSEYITIAIDNSILFREGFIFSADMIFDFQRSFSADFTEQVSIICAGGQLKGHICVIAETIIKIIVEDGSAYTERHLPAEVRKQIQIVMVVMLNNGQWSMQNHPVNQIGKLAHSSAYPT